MSLFNLGDKAYLMLANGRIFEGYSFGAKGTAYGEVVFSTSMTGYEEALSDPSNYGQILTQTFPLIGNYGVNDEDYESSKLHASGYVVREWCNAPSNFRCQGDIDAFLKKHNVVGIHTIDTRALTKLIREEGAMNGVITTENVYEKKDELLKKVQEFKIENAIKAVTCEKVQKFEAENAEYNVVIYDLGCKNSFRDAFLKKGCNVTVVPAGTSAEEVMALNPDGVVISNGAGNPEENTDVIAEIKKLSEKKVPMFAIGLGHQMTALAAGGKTAKLKYGHRGANQPVLDVKYGNTYVTAQNTGYTIVNDSITAEMGEITHRNANEGNCEGIRYKNFPCITVQFPPEFCGGPKATAYIFEEFAELMKAYKEVK